MAAGLLLLLSLFRAAFAQTDGGSVTGTVVESWDAKPLAGVTVSVRGTTLATTTDAAGQYRLERVPPGDHTLRFSRAGYATAVVTDVRVLLGQLSRVDGVLRPEFYELEEYVVTAEEFQEQAVQLLQERQEAGALIEAIGSERFSRLAAGDAAEILTKITGVSVVEGKFAVIRGLSDRYNLALLNGADVPSADPYRKAAQLDLFPAEVIENVVVSKTFTPDLPGGFSGGAMDIQTKSFPERFLLRTSAGVGYNTQATGNPDFLTYPGGGLDAFALDDGTRALPTDLDGVSGDDLEGLLRTATSGSRTIPLEEKTAAALEMDRLTRYFGTPYMGPTPGAPPPDHGFDFLVGDTVKLGGRPFGYFAGLSYERDFRHYDQGVRRRYTPADGAPNIYQDYTDTRSVALSQWSGIANLAYQFLEDHQLAYTFLYAQNAEDMARRLFGRIESSGEDQFEDDRRTHLNTLQWAERNLNAHQFQGEHTFPALRDLRLDWLTSLAGTSQEEPDLRYFNFISYPNPQDPESPLRGVDLISNNTPFPERPTRYFRDLTEDNLNTKIDLTLPVEDGRGFEWKGRTGWLLSRSTREFFERTFSYAGGSGSLVDTPTFPYEYMLGTNAPPPQLVTQNNRQRYVFSRSLDSRFGNSFYDGQQDIDALYAMGEVPLLETLRLIGGVRYETTFLEVSSSAFQSDETFTGTIEEGDLLPALGLVWDLRKDLKLRASYSQTLARPTYREFARYRSFDVAGDQVVEGNPNLALTHIRNLDVRGEWFTSSGGLLSVGSFVKWLEQPIEKFNATLSSDGSVLWTASSDFVTFLNTDAALALGAELEARQNLAFLDDALEPFSLGLNFSWIYSQVELQEEIREMKLQATGQDVSDRPLYDQSPYILNFDFSYDNTRTGTSVTLAYYYAAERLSLIVNNGWDIYEQAAPSLDLVISQKLGKGFAVKFSAENLLNPEVIRSYGVSGPTDTTYLYSSFTRGITFGLSFSYQY